MPLSSWPSLGARACGRGGTQREALCVRRSSESSKWPKLSAIWQDLALSWRWTTEAIKLIAFTKARLQKIYRRPPNCQQRLSVREDEGMILSSLATNASELITHERPASSTADNRIVRPKVGPQARSCLTALFSLTSWLANGTKSTVASEFWGPQNSRACSPLLLPWPQWLAVLCAQQQGRQSGEPNGRDLDGSGTKLAGLRRSQTQWAISQRRLGH